jgi:osomolarity two-component system, response regulator SSK1
MDIQLPVMDGITCTKKIRACEKENKAQQMRRSLPREVQRSLSFDTIDYVEGKETEFRSPVIIVALTASSLDSDRQEALAAGCNDFLTKPVSLEWLERKITEWGCMQALIDYEGWRQWREAKQSTTSKQVIDDKQPETISKPVQPERKPSSSSNRSGILMKGGSAIKPPSQRSATT